MSIAVYVPKPGLHGLIAPKSGVVGSTQGVTDRVMIDYEGNLFGAVNLERYANRVARAYDRHVTRYPTVARAFVSPDELIQIGTYEPAEFGVLVYPGGAMNDLAEWLGVEEVDLIELVVGS